MDWAAQNSGYVIASYAISALALVAMVVAILWRDQRLALVEMVVAVLWRDQRAAKDTEKRIDRV